ncbi:glycosyltransferase involved in cell wall biosynthesis [Dysgonomonadaceae bacterium PH5-43]|nr:glycosyltransferase involved in cell wall biosynthesis [Dysgonomonadaceae bacterium PH5-43]
MSNIKKNIAFTYITPFHPERGGIGRVTHNLTLEFKQRGYNVFYLIYDSAITIKYDYNYPVPLTYFPSKELLSEENISFYHNYLIENQIDIVINQSGNFSDSKLYLNVGNLNVKVVSVLHQPPWISYHQLWEEMYPLKNKSKIEKLKRIVRIMLYPKLKYKFKQSRINHFNFLLPRTDLVCMLSKNYYRELSEICSGFEYKYVAIPNPNTYDEPKITIKKRKQIIYVGLLVRNKRVDRLLKIWSEIYRDYPDWELILLT